jgi:hypothetical protein
MAPAVEARHDREQKTIAAQRESMSGFPCLESSTVSISETVRYIGRDV